jgi:Family of unknown function (DUF6069)
MSLHEPATVTTSAPAFAPGAATTWRVGVTSGAAALAVNAVVFAVARGAGADMLVRRQVSEQAMAIGLGTVALMTLMPMLAATLLLLALRRWGPRSWRALAIIGLVVALVTVPAPFTVLASTSTQMALALMHVVAGVAWFTVVRRAATRQVA